MVLVISTIYKNKSGKRVGKWDGKVHFKYCGWEWLNEKVSLKQRSQAGQEKSH